MLLEAISLRSECQQAQVLSEGPSSRLCPHMAFRWCMHKNGGGINKGILRDTSIQFIAPGGTYSIQGSVHCILGWISQKWTLRFPSAGDRRDPM